MTNDDALVPPALSLPDLFLKFLRFGCLAFGGPVAQIAMIRRFVPDIGDGLTKLEANQILTRCFYRG